MLHTFVTSSQIAFGHFSHRQILFSHSHSIAMLPPLAAPPAEGQNVVYHVYQHGYVDSMGANVRVNGINLGYYLRPVLLFFQWAFWIIYLAGSAQASSDGARRSLLAGPDSLSPYSPTGAAELQQRRPRHDPLRPPRLHR